MKTKIPNRKAIAALKRAGKDAERKQFGTTVRILNTAAAKELRIPVDGHGHPQRFEIPAKVLLSRSRHSSSSR